MASAVAPPKTPTTTTSTDPLYSAALAQAKAALAAEQAPVQAEQKASDAQYAQRQTDATGEAAALAKLLGAIGPQVQSDYTAATQNQGLLANGFSAGMKDALQGNTDNLNSMLKALGQPTQLDSHAGEAADVTYGKGGYIPGTTFNREGAAFTAAADMLPGTALLKGQENVKSLRTQAIVADQGFQNKIAEMAGKLPGDVQTNYQNLQKLSLEDAKFREQVRNDNLNAAYKQANFKLATAKYQSDVQYKNAQLQLGSQRLRLEANRMAQQQFQQDRAYQLSLARLGLQQKSLQLRVMQASFANANGGISQKDLNKYRVQAQSIAMDAFNGHTVYTTVNGKRVASMTPQLTFAEALGKILAKGIPVQTALAALDRVYPANQRPTPDILARELGPLDPQAMAQVIAHNRAVDPGVAKGLGAAAGAVSSIFRGSKAAMTAVADAKKFLGTPYLWGGESPKGFDCSGLIQYVWHMVGVNISRTTYTQWKEGRAVGKGQLQPGDAVFFQGSDGRGGLPGHVGMYIGNGLFIEAPHTGANVRISHLAGYPGYMGARRFG